MSHAISYTHRLALAAILAPCAIALIACGGGTSKGATTDVTLASASSALKWSECDDGLECATLAVPMDHDGPDGEKLTLALIRHPAERPDQRIGSLLINPGGPGGSGVAAVRHSGGFYSQVLVDRFDIVGFDPRGVGDSRPAIKCLDDIDRFIEEHETRERAADADRAFAVACGMRTGELLNYVSAVDVAHDMDLIRQALGDDKLTYIGFSYGTLLGALYADIYPTHVRALVLDGAIDPSLTGDEHVELQDEAFDLAVGDFLDACAANSTCPFHSDGDPYAAFDSLLDRIEDAPLTAEAAGAGRTVDLDLAWTAIDAALYDRENGWPELADALALAAEKSDGSGLLALADAYNEREDDGSYTNGYAAFIAINCIDSGPSSDGDATPEPDPSLGPDEPAWSEPCDFWPYPPARTPAAISARGAPPIFIVGTRRDPATPYREAQRLSEQLRSGRLLTFDGDGHTAYGKSRCIDDAVDAYLIDLTLPNYGKVCE